MTYQLHPLCTFFPRIEGAEFTELVEDIHQHGLRNPIVLLDGMILDGGNRYRACIEAGVEPTFTQYEGDDPVGFVLSANLHRRHLSAGQRAAIVASAADWAKVQTRGGDRRSDQSGRNDFDSVAARAERAAVNRDTQLRADKVAKADPGLVQKVARGEVSLPKAVEQITGKRPGAKAEKPESAEVETLRAEVKDLRDELSEARSILASETADNLAIGKIIDADDKLAEAAKEIRRLTSLVASLEDRIRGLMNEKNEAIRDANSWRRKAERLMKAAA